MLYNLPEGKGPSWSTCHGFKPGPECLPDFMQVVLWLPLTRWQKVPQARPVFSDQAELRSYFF